MIKENNRINEELQSMEAKKMKLLNNFNIKLKQEAMEGGRTLNTLHNKILVLEQTNAQHALNIESLTLKLKNNIAENETHTTNIEEINIELANTKEENIQLMQEKEQKIVTNDELNQEITEIINDSKEMEERYDTLKLKFMTLETSHEKQTDLYMETKEKLRGKLIKRKEAL